MPEEIRESVLPFSTLSENRVKPFKKQIERAAIFSLAELERAKGGRFLSRQLSEKLLFIAEVYYPFWLVPLDKTGHLFDGLSTISHALTYLTIPEVQVFLDGVKRSSRTRQAYEAFLSNNLNYFQVLGSEEEKIMDGLITDPEFLNEFTPYLSEAAPMKNLSSDVVKISPTLDEPLISSTMREIQNLKSKFADDANALCSSMKGLNVKSESFLKTIREEIRRIKEKFNGKIEKSKDSIAAKVDEIHRTCDEKVTKYSKKIEKRLLSLQQEKIKLEKAKEQLNEEIEHCEAERKSSAISKNGVTEQKWKEERGRLKKQLSENEKKLKEISKKIDNTKEEKNLEILKLKSKSEVKVKDAMKDLVEIESSRDAGIRIYRDEMEKLEELTSSIIDQIDKLAKMREKSVDGFRKLGFQLARKKPMLVHMPFYLVCYQHESGKRYVHFPPSIVNNVSFSVKFSGALGRAKIKRLLVPRSNKTVSLLNRFPLLMEQNAVFNREMNEACAKADILRTGNSRESVRIGLEKLREEGWLSEREYESLSQMLM